MIVLLFAILEYQIQCEFLRQQFFNDAQKLLLSYITSILRSLPIYFVLFTRVVT